jgi:hypothetical protein
MFRMRRFVLVMGSLCLFAAGCSAAPASGGAAPSAAAPSASAQVVSTVAQMICGVEAGEEIEQSIGVATTQPVAPTFVQQVYSCKYVYDGGSMVLAVREYADKAATDAGWAADRASAAPATDLPAIGQMAFAGPDGSVFVRKDAKVLHVDVSGLPIRFGLPSRSKAGIAQIVAVVIMNCWKEG